MAFGDLTGKRVTLKIEPVTLPARTVRKEAELPPTSISARTGEKIVSTALGQTVPIVIGTGRVPGIFVLGGTRIINTTTYSIEEESYSYNAGNYKEGGRTYDISGSVGSGYDIRPKYIIPTTIITETAVPDTTTETVALCAYVLAFDALKTGYDLIRLEVNGEVIYDTENQIGAEVQFRFYGGRQTATDQIATDIIGPLSGAYQNFVMIFLDGYPADSAPSLEAIISNAATDQPEDQPIRWTGQGPDVSPLQTNPGHVLLNLHGANAAYDPGRGVIYNLLNPWDWPELNLGSQLWLSVLDIDTHVERYRIPLEGADLYAIPSTWINAIRGTDYVLVRYIAATSQGLHRIYDTVTGKMMGEINEHLAVGRTCTWAPGGRYGDQYVFVGDSIPPGGTITGAYSPSWLVINLSDFSMQMGLFRELINRNISQATYGRMKDGTISFFMALFQTTWTATGDEAGYRLLPGEGSLTELVWNGTGWQVIDVQIIPVSTPVSVLWFDPLTGYLVTVKSYSRIEYTNPDTGVIIDAPFTGGTNSYPFNLPAQSLGTNYGTSGTERYWPKPGHVLMQNASGEEGAPGPAPWDQGELYDLNIDAQTITSWSPEQHVVYSGYYSMNIFDQNKGYYITCTYSEEWIIKYLPNSIPGLIDLDKAVTDVMSLAEIPASELRFEGFAGLSTYGFTIGSDTTFQAILAQIAEIYSFSFCDTGDGIFFKKAGQGESLGINVTLDSSSIVERATPVRSTDESDFATPIETWLEYISKEQGYRSRPCSFSLPTGVTGSIRRIRFSSPIVMTDQFAQQFVTEKHFNLQENRRSHTVMCQPSLMEVLPGDIAAIPSGPLTYLAQVEQMAMDLKTMSVEINARDFQTSVETTITAVTNDIGRLVMVKFATQYFHLDVPLLNYTHDMDGTGLVQYGFLAGIGQEYWPGGILYRGPSPSAMSGVFDQAPHLRVSGMAMNVLPDMPDPHSGDFTNSLTVMVTNGDLSKLENAPESEVMTGTNSVFIGQPGRWELLGFMNVVDNEDGTVTLSNFPYRGYRGTEVYAGLHQANDIVLIAPHVEVRKGPHDISDLDKTLYFKPVAIPQDPNSAVAITRVVTGAAETPYAPVNLDAEISGPDIILNWDYRSRLAPWEMFAPSSPLPNFGEETLEFDIEIMSGATVIRTLTAVSNSQVYDSSQIAADFGSMPATLTYRVYMMSEVVGRGHRAQATITL